MTLQNEDLEIFDLISQEDKRQEETITLIPSENYCSKAVMAAVGSSLGNKYAEGYPGKRYYQGNKIVDEVENIAIERAKKLFGVPYVNVQPYSGSPANTAVLMALLNPGDKIMGLALSSGGHLTHGHPKITFSGRFYNSIQYAVEDNGFIDYKKLEKQVLLEKPKLLICGTTSYPRILEFEKFAKIANLVGAYLLADISHIAGLVVGGVHPSPVPFADVIMTTTHKTLRRPRGAILMVTDKGLKKDPEMGKRIDRAVFPAIQGGPHENTIAGIAVALHEAQGEIFNEYANYVVKNAQELAKTLTENGLELVSGGTDNHLMVIDLRKAGQTGKEIAEKLEEAGIITNKNTIPNDPNPPAITSGIRIGTPAVTTRGMREGEMKLIGNWISGIIFDKISTKEVLKEVRLLCKKFSVNKI